MGFFPLKMQGCECWWQFLQLVVNTLLWTNGVWRGSYHVKIMLCFGAFGDVPDEDVAIMACRQHYPAIKGMGLQDKHFICMALQWKIAHHRETREIHISRMFTTEPKACPVLSGKLNLRQPQRFEHSKGKNFLDSSKSSRNMKLLPKDGELFNGWVTAQEFYLFHIYLFFYLQAKSKAEGSSKFWLKEFQGTPHLLYHPYRAFKTNQL